jgi:hypothetical protein
MTVSGLVITLHSPDRAADLRELLLFGPFVLGDDFGGRLAVALEADTPAAAERWHRWLLRLPGVAKVDVAFVHHDVPAPEEAAHVG